MFLAVASPLVSVRNRLRGKPRENNKEPKVKWNNKEMKEKEENDRDWGVWESPMRGVGMATDFPRIENWWWEG